MQEHGGRARASAPANCYLQTALGYFPASRQASANCSGVRFFELRNG